jgi:hypothetical protein
MRTTVTLDPDAEAMLRRAIAERGGSFKQVLNDAIREGLAPRPPSKRAATVHVPTFRSAYRGGVDRRRLQQLSDELETDAFISRQGAPSGAPPDEA